MSFCIAMFMLKYVLADALNLTAVVKNNKMCLFQYL